MPDNPESFLVDLLKRRNPTIVKEVTIAQKIEEMEKELADFKKVSKNAFAEKAVVEEDLVRRINQLKKLDGEQRKTRGKLDDTKVKLLEEEKRTRVLKEKVLEASSEAADKLRELEYEKNQELASVRAELQSLETKEAEAAEEAAAEEAAAPDFEAQIVTLQTQLEEVHAKLEEEAEARKAAEKGKAALDGELKKLSKLRLAAEHFFTDAGDVISPRREAI
jgi:chromosome segregation ATPase